MKKELKKYYIFVAIALIFIIILLVILFDLTLSSFIGKRKSQKNIINKFKENYLIFDSVKEELNDMEYIKFYNQFNSIYVDIYEEKDSGTIISSNIQDLEFSKYQNTIGLFRKFKLYNIEKKNQNVIFNFNSTLKLSQNIVYIKNIEKFNNENIIKNSKKIIDDWYYIETK